MDTVMLRSGRVDAILGTPVIDASGKISSYTGRTSTTGSFTASITGDVLTVTVVGSGTLWAGNVISGTGIPANTYVIDQLTGTTGGVGTYRLNKSTTFASGAITTDSSGLPKYKDSPWSSYQAVLQGTSGTLTSVITLYGSNDNFYWCATPIGSISLTSTGPTAASDGFTTVVPWKYVKAVITTLSGTGASVYVLQGV